MNEANIPTITLTDCAKMFQALGKTLLNVFVRFSSLKNLCISSMSICSLMKLAIVPGIAACLLPSIKWSVSNVFNLPNSSTMGGTSKTPNNMMSMNRSIITTKMESGRFFSFSLYWKKVTNLLNFVCLVLQEKVEQKTEQKI